MGSVLQFSIKSLRSEEVLGFCKEIEAKLVTLDSVRNSMQGKAFISAIATYSDALDVDRQMTYADLVKADAEVDQAIIGLRAHLQALLSYPVESVRNAATQIWNAIDQYGSPVKLPFAEEYAIVDRMLNTLEALDPALAETATVSGWIPALRERYDTFRKIMKAYDAERAIIVPGTIKSSRETLTDAWSPLCELLNSLNVISPSSEISSLIDEINVRIQSRKSAVKQRRSSRKSNKEAATDPVVIED